MQPDSTSSTAHALHAILQWSLTRPEWQRDALRRILLHDALTTEQLSYLHRLCRLRHNLEPSSDVTLTIEALAESHLPPGPGSDASVSLLSVGTLRYVNRLPSDQRLSFGIFPGLAVIYGDNGTGKSGFARVIKKACRTRGALPTIKPNIFSASATNPATAEIVFRVADTDYQLTWTDGRTADSRLGNIFVFDTVTARTYLEEAGPTAFTPFGLDILPKLSKACDHIGKLIQNEIDAVEQQVTAIAAGWQCPQNTEVASLIAGLSKSTALSKLDSLAGLSPTQDARLAEITSALSSDAKQNAKATRAGSARLRAFSQKGVTSAVAISDHALVTIRSLVDDVTATALAAATFSQGQFDTTYLPATGSDLWKQLWLAARAFAIDGPYKDQEYPVLEDNAKCVLCQQPLSPEAKSRMAAFDSFCKDQSQKLADEALKRLNAAVVSINAVEPLSTEVAKIESDLSPMEHQHVAAIQLFVDSFDSRLSTLKSNLALKRWSEVVALPQFPADAITALADKRDELATLEESADDPTLRQQLAVERNDLLARQWLATMKPAVLEQIERYKRIAALKNCKKDTATKSITDKNTELSTLLITEAFCQRFENEIRDLGLRTLSVKMEDAEGRKGERKFALRIVDALDHDLKQVASEGEQRCIALAAFLAELSLSSHQSALVFDDPVSSLDHGHRELIAKRLVRESKIRQIIVFTHDPVLVHELEFYSRQEVASITFRYLEWSDGIPGRCNDGLPWDFKSFLDRIDKLEKLQRNVQSRWQPLPNESNVIEMRGAYSLLRATLERMVEREVFADVVFRFRSYINVQNLERVIGFCRTECEEVLRLHRKYCDVTEAHDYAVGKHGRIPDPNELACDITALKALYEVVRTRQKANR